MITLNNMIYANPQAYQVFPEMVNSANTGTTERAEYSGYLNIVQDDLVVKLFTGTNSIDLSEFKSLRIRVDNVTDRGSVVLGEWDFGKDMSTLIMSSMVLWYDLKRQGATNENMAANPVLRDLSGNGHDATCYNFAWSGMSGIGGYEPKLFTETIQGNRNNIQLIDPYTIHISYLTNSNFTQTGCYWIVNKMTFRVILNVSGLQEGQDLFICQYNNNFERSVQLFEGKNDVTVDFEGTVVDNNPNYSFATFYTSTSGNLDVTIKLEPLYPNALVYDGVDDYVRSIYSINRTFNDYTVIVKCINKPQIGNLISYGDICQLLGNIANGAKRTVFGVFEYNGNSGKLYANSMGYANTFAKPDGVYDEIVTIYQTKDSFNGIYELNFYNDAITVTDKDYLVVGRSVSSVGRNNTYHGALYSLLIFDRDLTPEEIAWVKQNLMS